jgi:hypothetical protein
VLKAIISPIPLLITATVLAPQAQAVSITDSNFSSWSPFQFVTDDPTIGGLPPNVSTGSCQRLSSGGNTASFLECSHSVTAGDTSWVGGIKTDSVYNFASDGEILNLSLSVDVKSLTGSSAWQVVIEQSGTRYYSFPLGGITAGNWSNVSISNLTATDFDTNPWAGLAGVAPAGNRPNFSRTAAPLQFGFMFGNRIIGSGTVANTFGLDNFALTTTSRSVAPEPDPQPVPEPSSSMVGIIGIGAFLRSTFHRSQRRLNGPDRFRQLKNRSVVVSGS